MNPFGLAGVALGGLGALFGGSHSARQGPSLGQLQGVISPGAIMGDYNQLFNMLRGSPYGQSILNQSAMAGSQASNSLNRMGLAMGNTGMGQLARAAGSSTQGAMKGQALGGLSQMAMQEAMQNRRQLLQSYLQSQTSNLGQPGGLGSLFGGLAAGMGQAGSLSALFSGGGQGGMNQGGGWSGGQNTQWYGPGLFG